MIPEDELHWDRGRLPELVRRLAHGSGAGGGDFRPATAAGDINLAMERAARAAGVEVRPATLDFPLGNDTFRGLAPAVIRVVRGGDSFFLGIAAAQGNRVTFVDASGAERTATSAEVSVLLGSDLEADGGRVADEIVAAAELDGHAREAARRSIIQAVIGRRRLDNVWVFHRSPSSSIFRQVLQAGIAGRIGAVLALYVGRAGLLTVSWLLLGNGALDGRLEGGLVSAWALVILTYVAASVCTEWLQGSALLGVNILYRRKILHGTMKLAPEDLRSMGSGQLIGRVLETEALDTLAVTAGLGSLSAVVDVLAALLVFVLIPGGGIVTVLYLGWIGLVGWRGWNLYRAQRRWTHGRVDLADAFIETLRGRRTRSAQANPDTWHRGDDDDLASYAAASQKMDRLRARFAALSTHGWLAVAMIGAAPMAARVGASPGAIAATVGCILMAHRALGTLTSSLESIVELAIAWGQARAPYGASSLPDDPGIPEIAEMQAAEREQPPEPGAVILQASGIDFAHPRRDVGIERLDLTIRHGDRVLLEGPSGCGKTTLASLLSGLLRPSSGVLLLRGFDMATLGEHDWAKRVAYSPQFKDNHVFSATLAFNLLMGRRWPPTAADLEEAERLCDALGLGPLLARMPARLHQFVGETGWRLSHGERSRVFLARTLLQRPDVVILDETFGALDADTMRQCVAHVLKTAPAVLAIAHP